MFTNSSWNQFHFRFTPARNKFQWFSHDSSVQWRYWELCAMPHYAKNPIWREHYLRNCTYRVAYLVSTTFQRLSLRFSGNYQHGCVLNIFWAARSEEFTRKPEFEINFGPLEIANVYEKHFRWLLSPYACNLQRWMASENQRWLLNPEEEITVEKFEIAPRHIIETHFVVHNYESSGLERQ